MSNSDIEQTGTVKGHLPNEASLSGRISNGLSLSGHISIGGASDFIIRMTVEGDDEGNLTVTSCDTTVEQIDAAVADEKRVVVIASDGDFIYELPMLQGDKGYFYNFGTFLFGQMITASVEKSFNTSKWRFLITLIEAGYVGYSNDALPDIYSVKHALDALVTKSHSHSNKDVLDKFAESDGKPTYDGEALSGDFIIKMTLAIDDEGNLTVTSCDATVEQIDAAVAAEKRVVVIASVDGTIYELPMIRYDQGSSYYFYASFGALLLSAIVAKNTKPGADYWQFHMQQLTADFIGYSNDALPSITDVEEALNEIVPKSHSHANKDTLDKLSDSNGKLQYNGSDVGLKGDKGDTPVKGTDYWTETDKAEIVADTLAALPTWTGGSY